MKKFELYNYLDMKGSPTEIVNKIINKISNTDVGYAGYSKKEGLEFALRRFILDRKGENQHFYYKKEVGPRIRMNCKKALDKCENYLEKKIHIFLFPTFDKFVIEKMNGVSGFCPWDNTILIFINFTGNWGEYLQETLVHELAHAVSPYRKKETIGNWLILEGIAENFKDFIFPKSPSKWSHAISEGKKVEIFKEIRPMLNHVDFKKYSEIFFGTGKYPLWAGYTIGYSLVKRYLERKNNANWRKILRINPEIILHEYE